MPGSSEAGSGWWFSQDGSTEPLGFCLVLFFLRPMLLEVISDCGCPAKASSGSPYPPTRPSLGETESPFSIPPCLLQPQGPSTFPPDGGDCSQLSFQKG